MGKPARIVFREALLAGTILVVLVGLWYIWVMPEFFPRIRSGIVIEVASIGALILGAWLGFQTAYPDTSLVERSLMAILVGALTCGFVWFFSWLVIVNTVGV